MVKKGILQFQMDQPFGKLTTFEPKFYFLPSKLYLEPAKN